MSIRDRGIFKTSGDRNREKVVVGLIDQLLAVKACYDQAADRFIKKVDNGQAKSYETYRDLKAAREKSSRINVTI